MYRGGVRAERAGRAGEFHAFAEALRRAGEFRVWGFRTSLLSSDLASRFPFPIGVYPRSSAVQKPYCIGAEKGPHWGKNRTALVRKMDRYGDSGGGRGWQLTEKKGDGMIEKFRGALMVQFSDMGPDAGPWNIMPASLPKL
jgi:hypothetical protein